MTATTVTRPQIPKYSVSNVDCVHVIPSDDEADEIVAPTATNDPKKGDHATEVQVFVARVLVVQVMPSGDEAA